MASFRARPAPLVQSNFFAQAVVRAVQKIYPEKLADSSFDNTGLLLEAPHRPGLKNSVLLTVDLTRAVVDEAIKNKDSIIIAYHPIVFRPLKSLTLSNTQQSSLLRLAQEGISIYSPHTAVDATPGALNDFLADAITVKEEYVRNDLYEQRIFPHDRSVITPVKDPPPGFEAAGYGKIVRFHAPHKLGDIIHRITKKDSSLCLSAVSVAVPQYVAHDERSNIEISSVGICAGSGGSMLTDLDVDLLFTGELSHHEALAAIEQGKCVITTFHSNTERQFIKQSMATEVEAAIEDELKKMTKHGQPDTKADHFILRVSQSDADPFSVFTTDHHSKW